MKKWSTVALLLLGATIPGATVMPLCHNTPCASDRLIDAYPTVWPASFTAAAKLADALSEPEGLK